MKKTFIIVNKEIKYIFIILSLFIIKLQNLKNNNIIHYKNLKKKIEKYPYLKKNKNNTIVLNKTNNSKILNISNNHNKNITKNNKNIIDNKKNMKRKMKNEIYINPYNENEKKFYNTFINLKKFPNNLSDPLIEKEKNDIMEYIYKNIGYNITSIDIIYLNNESRFGNMLVLLNKLIFYSEIIGVNKIILNRTNNLYIKNSIFDEKYNLTIEVYNDNDTEYYIEQYTYANYLPNLFFIFFNIRVENRFDVIKNEILNNLPKVKINHHDLYIHIRGGDIFSDDALNPGYSPSYAQYPFCFYKKVIEKNKFNKIYIISEDKLNPVINQLIKRYPKIINYSNHTLEKDISYLAHAYNIIGSVSSFIISIIKLNSNLKFFWEYDIYQMEQKLYHLHHSIYDFPRNYTIFRMEPSEQYKKYMYIWSRTKEQIKIMFNDTCPNDFKIIRPKK